MKDAAKREIARERVREIAAEHAERGDQLGWFDAVYSSAGEDIDNIPWADLEPNRFFKDWAEEKRLKGNGRKALVVGCGLGDDARYLYDLGFEVTAFDISSAAIEWAKRLHKSTDIEFVVADLFSPPSAFFENKNPPAAPTTPSPKRHPSSGRRGAGGSDKAGAFEFVLEIYTIQPLPMEMRERAIDAVASFVAPAGELVVVCRGRDDDEEVGELPYPLSKKDLSRFVDDGLVESEFVELIDDEDGGVRRFVVDYRRPRN